MKSKYSYLFGNIKLFIIASFIPKALDLCMVSLYTRCLTDADYGIADLLANTVQLIMPVLTLQIQDAVLRDAMDERYQKKDVLGVGVRIACSGGIILLCVLVVLQATPFISIDIAYILFVLINYIAGSLNNIFSYFCRGIDRVKSVTMGSGLSALIIVICNVLFLTVFHWGLYGYLTASTLGVLASAAFQFFHAKLYKYISFQPIPKTVYSEMLTISIPMVFSALAWWVNNASDKYILTWLDTVAVVGLYAVANKVPSSLALLSNVVSKAFSISAIKEYDANDTDGFIGHTYSLMSFLMTLCCSGIMLINIPIAKILFSDEFFSAWRFVPPLLLSVLFNQMALLCQNVFLAIKNTKIISKTLVSGAILNTILNLALIPKFSAYGAAVATAVGFGVVWAAQYVVLKRYIRFKNEPRKEVFSYLLLVLQAVLAQGGNSFIAGELVIFVVLLIMYKKTMVKMISYGLQLLKCTKK